MDELLLNYTPATAERAVSLQSLKSKSYVESIENIGFLCAVPLAPFESNPLNSS